MPVIVETSESKNFIVCTLSKANKLLQQTLQLTINAGEHVSFHLNCEKGSVHLTGYYLVPEECEHEHDEADAKAMIQRKIHPFDCNLQ